jgi:hypothetical protein
MAANTPTVTINVSQLTDMARRMRNTPALRNATEIAANNASNIIVRQAKQNHIFTSRSFTLENSIFTEIDGNSIEIFVPSRGPLGVPYVPWIYFGSRPNPSGGADITWNNGAGDPFIDNAFDTKKAAFVRSFRRTLTIEMDEFIGV